MFQPHKNPYQQIIGQITQNLNHVIGYRGFNNFIYRYEVTNI